MLMLMFHVGYIFLAAQRQYGTYFYFYVGTEEVVETEVEVEVVPLEAR